MITGASGAGKSTLLTALAERGFSVMPEVALSIMQEQERCGGSLLPSVNLQAFMDEVVTRNLQAYDMARSLPTPVFFDRAIPECLGHMQLLGLDIAPNYFAQATARPYANTVFIAEPWPEIYVRDQWRRAPFERAARSFESTVTPYMQAGYTTRVLPRTSVAERVAFVLEAAARDGR